MSLVKLLTTGKSLVGLNDSTCRYRMRSKNLLPKFGSEKNPFAPGAQLPLGPEADRAGRQKETEKPTVPEGLDPDALKRNLETAPEAARGAVAVRPEKPGPGSGAPVPAASGGRLMRWVRKWLPFKSRSARQAPIPRFQKTAVRSSPGVQTELSLDNIKVVRNDLSEADVEVVAAKSAAAPAPVVGAPVPAAPVPAAAAKADSQSVEKRFAAELAGDAWNRTAARVLSKS